MQVHCRVSPALNSHLHTVGGDRHCESKAPCSRAQCNVLSQSSSASQRVHLQFNLLLVLFGAHCKHIHDHALNQGQKHKEE